MVMAQPLNVRTAKEAQDVASRITNPQRSDPLIAVSVRDETSTVVDVDELVSAVGIHGLVVTVPTTLLQAMNARLPPNHGLAGDAVRVYPPAKDWTTPPTCMFFRAQADRAATLRAVVNAAGVRARPAHAVPPGAVAPPQRRAGEVIRVADSDGVHQLLVSLLSTTRTKPVVVVTIPARAAVPYIDADKIAAALGAQADVYLIPTGRLTHQVSDVIGDMQGVYGGAGRVYHPDRRWMHNPYASLLVFAFDAEQGREATETLIGEALAMMPAGVPEDAGPAHVAVAGRVTSLVGETRAVVALDHGGFGAIWAGAAFAGLPIDRLVEVGQHVEGEMDLETKRIDVGGSLTDLAEALRSYSEGSIILVQVGQVGARRMTVSLAPGVTVEVGIEQVTGNPLDRLTDLVTPGEVLSALVTKCGAVDGRWSLDLSTIDPDEPPTVDPPSLLPDGPPWLVVPDVEDETEEPGPTEDAAGHHYSGEVPGEVVDAAEQQAELIRRAIADARFPTAEPAGGRDDDASEASHWRATVRSQQDQIARLKADVERLKTHNRKARAGKQRPRETTPVVNGFDDPEEQLRWEVYRTWVHEVPASEKVDWPLAATWHVGPHFIETLDTIDFPRERVLSVVVQILCGKQIRECHALRVHPAGGARPVVRPDGATCWRAPLQLNSPQARRVHFWRRKDGTIELSRVVFHEDFTP